MLLQPNDHILFYGDSITDAGRREKSNNNSGLGVGYPALIAATLGARFPHYRFKFTNAGISGNRICDLEKRLQADVLDCKPTVVSILIGINDTWRRYDRDTISPIGEFQAAYSRICQAVKGEGCRLVLCEPFLLPASEDRNRWREDLDPRIQAVRAVAREFADRFVPLDGLFAAAACRREIAYWLPDGVHPTPFGHGLIAEAWIDEATR